ncbi:NAD-binding protein [Curvibacter sp. HBC28]|uniref:NAD-binding protein n=1 Tax=Curvibacter microcysteis TaxID=3026419 RepID=A0ABT5MC93_9BURK|nr:NAD-binding protein [Curvibacter sp. HBC28]MDD0814183.1 NAD-binding protein [Curvibacter sp. HBC28]
MKNLLQNRHFSGLMRGAGVLVVIQAIGTVGYHYIGRPTATWIDSFYMTFITIATIGYGETVDLTYHPLGRLFTVGIAVIGIGTMSYLFSTLVALLVDYDLNAAFRRRRMDKEIAGLSGHYIVCGIGRVGSNVAHELTLTRRPFVVIEPDREALDRWLEHHPEALFLHDDAADDEALQRAGVARAAGVFAVTGEDSHNLMISLSVKLIQPSARVVVRLHDIRNEKKARRAGADEIVSPDFTGGVHIASAMLRPQVVNFMEQMMHSEEAMRVEEVTLPAGMAPTSLGQLLPRSRDHVLLAVHEGGRWVFNPDESHTVVSGVTLVLMVSPHGRAAVESRLSALAA